MSNSSPPSGANKKGHRYAFATAGALTILSLVVGFHGLYDTASAPLSSPVEGTTFYPRGINTSLSWVVHYHSDRPLSPWEFTRKMRLPDGSIQTEKYNCGGFTQKYPLDLGRAIRPSDLRHVVINFASPEKNISIAHLTMLKVALGCPDSVLDVAKTKLSITRD